MMISPLFTPVCFILDVGFTEAKAIVCTAIPLIKPVAKSVALPEIENPTLKTSSRTTSSTIRVIRHTLPSKTKILKCIDRIIYY